MTSQYIKTTAEDQGYYHVFVDGVKVSQHLAERKAIEKGGMCKVDSPDSEVYYTHSYKVFVSLVDKPVVVPPVVEPEPEPPVVVAPPVDPLPAQLRLITPANLRLIGGYRVHHWSGVGVGSTGYAYGGATIATHPDGRTTCWCMNNENERVVVESSTTAEMGIAGTDPATWPMMAAGGSWPVGQLFDMSNLPPHHSGTIMPNGMAWNPDDNCLYVSGMSKYYGSSESDPASWIGRVQYPGKQIDQDYRPKLPRSTQHSARLMQCYGGAMTLLPKAFADTHTNGSRIAAARGGFASGQHGSAGPAMAILKSQSELQEVFRFAPTDEIGLDVSNGLPYTSLERCERGLPDYKSFINWSYPVIDGVGYFATTSVRGNPAWVNHDKFKGVIWPSLRPIGDIKYEFQTECLSEHRRPTWHVYDPDDIAKGISGELGVFDQRAVVHDFTPYKTVPGTIRSLTWDDTRKVLWAFSTRVWKRDSGPEWYPIICAFELVE